MEIMKKFISIILSFSLMISPIGFTSKAIADVDEHKKDLEKKLKFANQANQLVGLAIGTVGSTVLLKCKLSKPSIMAFQTGSVAYIYDEVTSAEKLAKQMKKQAEKLDALKSSNPIGGEIQLAAMEAQLKDQEQSLKFIKRRIGFLTAISVAYTGALVATVAEGFAVSPPPICIPNKLLTSKSLKMLSKGFLILSTSGGKPKVNATMVAALTSNLIKNKSTENLEKVTPIVDNTVMTAMNSAVTRGAFFTLLTATMIFVIRDELVEQRKVTEKNISDLKTVIKNFKESLKSDGGLTIGKEDGELDPLDVAKINNGKGSVVKPNTISDIQGAEEDSSKTCIGSDYSISEAACSNKLKLEKLQLDRSIYSPELISEIQGVQDFTNAVIDGDVERAETISAGMQNSATRLQKINEDLLVKINQKLVADGKKPLNLDEEAKKQLKSSINNYDRL